MQEEVTQEEITQFLQVDIFDEKAIQLAEMLDIELSDIEIEIDTNDESRSEFKTPYGTYTVMTEEEVQGLSEQENFSQKTQDFHAFQLTDTDDRECVLHKSQHEIDR